MSTYFSAGVSPFTAGVGEAPVCCLVGGRSVFTHRFRRPPGRSLAHARLWRPVCSSRLAGSVSAAPRRGACWWCFEMVAAASPRCMVRYDRRSCAVIRRYWRRYHSIVRSSPSRSDIVGSKSNCSVTFESVSYKTPHALVVLSTISRRNAIKTPCTRCTVFRDS